MNRKLGMCSSAVTFIAVLGFSISMIVKSDYGSYLSSSFIAFGFLPMICAFASYGKSEEKSFGYTAVAFASVYTVLIMLVYFAQLTTVEMFSLNEQTLNLLDYKRFGLFFNYDLLGYCFMSLATFYVSFIIKTDRKPERLLKILLRIHGIFAVSCFIIPMLGLFKPGIAGGELTGILVLEVWCLYFLPVCILSFIHFKQKPN